LTFLHEGGEAVGIDLYVRDPRTGFDDRFTGDLPNKLIDEPKLISYFYRRIKSRFDTVKNLINLME
jgi:transposase